MLYIYQYLDKDIGVENILTAIASCAEMNDGFILLSRTFSKLLAFNPILSYYHSTTPDYPVQQIAPQTKRHDVQKTMNSFVE